MKYLYFEGSCGLSGDMILGALLDLGLVSPAEFKKTMAKISLPVEIVVREVKRASLRGLKVDVKVDRSASKGIGRKLDDVRSLIKALSLQKSVKLNSLAVFERLFKAEAKVHGRLMEKTHLHEAGADDAIIDIVGTCWLAHALDIGTFSSTPLNVGEGWVKAAHGVLPVPPPAVAELLKGIPLYSAWIKHEGVTPTGAAIVSTLCREFRPFPEICYEKIGYGAGSRNLPDFPNILRVFYGDSTTSPGKNRHFQIEANIDDANPQVLAHFLETALKAGAKDVYLTPVVMKKNRLGTKLTVLAEIDKIDVLIQAIFRETPSIGVRFFPVERRILDRQIQTVNVLGENVAVKIASLDGQEINVQPEFKDCLRVAKKTRLPVKRIIDLAIAGFASGQTRVTSGKT